MAAERPGSESVSESAVEDFGDRAAGCLVGLAVGDALGGPREGAPPCEAVTEMEAVGGLPSGTWSDDTAQALAIAESLIDRGRFDPDDVAARHVEWYGSGGPGLGRGQGQGRG